MSDQFHHFKEMHVNHSCIPCYGMVSFYPPNKAKPELEKWQSRSFPTRPMSLAVPKYGLQQDGGIDNGQNPAERQYRIDSEKRDRTYLERVYHDTIGDNRHPVPIDAAASLSPNGAKYERGRWLSDKPVTQSHIFPNHTIIYEFYMWACGFHCMQI